MTLEKDLMNLHRMIDVCRRHTEQNNERLDEIYARADDAFKKTLLAVSLAFGFISAIFFAVWSKL